MPEVFPRHVLLRVGGRTLQRFGALAVAGSRRGLVDAPFTFGRADAATCATYFDRNGVLRLAAANVPRVEWVDLDGDGVRETAVLLLEGSHVNLCLRSEEFDHATWTGLATVAANTNVAPDGTTSADTLTDDDAAAFESKIQTFTVANDSLPHVIGIFVRKTTAATNTFGINIALSGGTGVSQFPRLNTNSGVVAAGSDTRVVSAGDYWLLVCKITNNSSGNTSLSVQIFPATGTNSGSNPGSDNVAATGSAVVWGAMVVKAAFLSSYTKTVGSAVTRAADTFTMPFNFGPFPTTIVYRFARFPWADASSDIGLFPTPLLVSSAVPRLETYFGQTVRQFNSRSGDSASNASRNIPSGAELKFVSQHKDLSSAPAVAVDVGDGSGLTAFDTGATAFAAYANQTLNLCVSGGQPFGGLIEIIVLRGLFSRDEALAVP